MAGSAFSYPTWTVFDVPGAVATQPVAINAAGDVTGTWIANSSGQLLPHGFVRKSDGTITAFDVPGALETLPVAINSNGSIAGSYVDVSYVFHGFLRAMDGTMTTFDFPGPSCQCGSTVGMNEVGTIVGWSYTGAFIRAPDGSFMTFDVAGISAFPSSINDFGAITGQYNDHGCDRGFIRNSGGVVTTFEIPNLPCGFDFGAGFKINNSGYIAGSVLNSTQTSTIGFLRAPDGTSTTFFAFHADIPGPEFTLVLGLNSLGQIAGNGSVQSNVAFLSNGAAKLGVKFYFRDSDGSITAFSVPGCQAGWVAGLNDAGLVAGVCADVGNQPNSKLHGYLTNVR